MNENEILKEKYIKSKEAFRDLISRANNGENITKSEKGKIFSYLRHVPNIRKTEEEFELYCKMAQEKGLPKPDRNLYVRPLHEKH
ncbi:hypothetical protein [Veillonella montpellierensis]|uniref:hypothetical protein n=1 Tax=Veillonella montpellierensis TaxID=187328 RepID=UPI00041B2EB4|nr:hypothetical protein [Veillonella montpellierensis]